MRPSACCNLSLARVQHLSFGAYQRHGVRKGVHDIQFELERGIAFAGRQRRMHGAAHGRIEERCEPAPVDGAKRVVMPLTRSSLEDGRAIFDVDRHEVERVPDGRAG